MAIELTAGRQGACWPSSGFDPVLGARPLRRTIQREIEDPLSEKILFGELRAGPDRHRRRRGPRPATPPRAPGPPTTRPSSSSAVSRSRPRCPTPRRSTWPSRATSDARRGPRRRGAQGSALTNRHLPIRLQPRPRSPHCPTPRPVACQNRRPDLWPGVLARVRRFAGTR